MKRNHKNNKELLDPCEQFFFMWIKDDVYIIFHKVLFSENREFSIYIREVIIMTERKTYFITVDTEDIRETSIPDGIEYEVYASQSEINEIKELFDKKDQDTKNAVKYLAKPFNEWGADDERQKYDDHLIMIFRRIYDLGTEETKKNISKMGIFN